jgi:dihydropteroate synthase
VSAGVPVSIDTMRSQCARAAVAEGACIVNDVSGGLADPDMHPTVAEVSVPYVAMHWRGHSDRMNDLAQYDDVALDVMRELRDRVDAAAAAGIDPASIVVDPGLGFAKNAAGSLELLARLGELRSLGRPILAGASRKSFIGKTLGIEDPKDRLEGSLAAASLAVWNGAHIVRAHDVRATRRAVDLAWAVRRAPGG